MESDKRDGEAREEPCDKESQNKPDLRHGHALCHFLLDYGVSIRPDFSRFITQSQFAPAHFCRLNF